MNATLFYCGNHCVVIHIIYGWTYFCFTHSLQEVTFLAIPREMFNV